jgi:predicted nucleic acid-binding protein
MNEERATAIVGIRIYPSLKKELMEDAMERGQTLTGYVYDLLMAGREQLDRAERLTSSPGV